MRAHNNQMGLKKILSCSCSGCSQSHRFREFSGWNMLIWFFPLIAFGSRAGENFLVSKLQRSSWRLSWKRGHIFPLKSFPFRQPEAKTQMRQDQSRGYLCQKYMSKDLKGPELGLGRTLILSSDSVSMTLSKRLGWFQKITLVRLEQGIFWLHYKSFL